MSITTDHSQLIKPARTPPSRPVTATAWEERWHPLREEWVIIAAHRNHRPWTGASISHGAAEETPPSYVSDCYFCPGNVRVHGAVNDRYTGIFVFENDLPCVSPDAPVIREPPPGKLYRNRPAQGLARVVCYSPLHNVTLAELPVDQVVQLLKCWQEQYVELGQRPEVEHVLVFENKGKVVGVSNPHPHCQIYATNFVYKTIAVEVEVGRQYWRENRRVLFEDIIESEEADGRRIIAERDAAIAFIPYFARYAYETYVAPKQAHQSIADLSPEELADLASVLRDVVIMLDNLWKMPFPYVLAIHQAPTKNGPAEGFHFHLEIHPPLRSPHLLKYLAGPEIGGGSFLSDTSPEEKADELRTQSTVHYKTSRGSG